MALDFLRIRAIFNRLTPHLWWLATLVALGAIWIATTQRIERVVYLSDLEPWSVDSPQFDAASPSGLDLGQRKLIVPGHHDESFSWIMEAQRSVAEKNIRLRSPTDETPNAFTTNRTSPYRWWLIAVGWVHKIATDKSFGRAIEDGSLYADPVLLSIMLVVGATYCVRYFGRFPAIGFALGSACLFPLAANFQPGAPDPRSLAWMCALGSILPLLPPLKAASTHTRKHFIAAGIFGGIGLWNDTTSQVPVLIGSAIGALAYAFVRGRYSNTESFNCSPWRAWAITGASATLAASVFEFSPNYFSWSLDVINPIHALAWLGIGFLAYAVERFGGHETNYFSKNSLVATALPIAFIAAWPITAIASGTGSLMAEDFSSIELANHSNGIRVSSFASWLNSKGDSGIKWATILPVILTMFALIRAFSKKTDSEERARILLVASIALTVLVFSFNQLRWWNLYDVIALALLSTLSVCKRENSSSAIFVFKILGIGAILLPGLVVGFPSTSDAVSPAPLSLIERQTLLERDFAYYLVKHNGKRPITLFSSPSVSKAVSFYGNIDSMDWTDEQELQAAARLASATTSTEAAVLLDSLGVTHLAFPSWNSDVEQLVRLGMRLPQGAPLPRESFYTKLQRWNLPLWIHPMSYVVPKDEGFAEISLQVLSITEEQEPELAASRLADHFIEQRLIDQTKSIRETLLLYPRSLPAITAITNIDIALNDKEPLRDSLEKALSYATRRSAKNLFIDRRISLAALLFQVNEKELARSQMNDCLKDIDVETIRILTTGNIVRVIVFSNYFNIPFNDENAKALALELIPPSIRSRVLENK